LGAAPFVFWSTLTAGKPIGNESFGRISFGRMTGLVIWWLESVKLLVKDCKLDCKVEPLVGSKLYSLSPTREWIWIMGSTSHWSH
jgi:hypothetical protein